ncbi:MAG TPA: 16S rRNA (adenine(1518)-N(6)/adenine(1519)-N(6))-dimethyltransferase RsmA [Gemmatimonadota bacterium]|nr:16S rRNA (adenine(1518)-N(6)/adenine(1519)-N(6))-dimethyltransferase RsmA [Gemmatimonadota bacterium]
MTPRLSQHFLHDRGVAARIVDSIGAPPGARIVEIGPGRGALTEPLLARGYRVLAIELDPELAASLRRRWPEGSPLTVVVGDALEVPLPAGGSPDPAWVVGNLPYAVTSPLLFRILEQVEVAAVRDMVFMIQREVAERLAADPGTKAYGALTVGVRLLADVEILFEVGSGAFQPPPAVVSTVVRLTPHDRFGLSAARRERVRSLVRDLFTQRRKQIQKSLRTLDEWGLDPAGVEEVARRTGLDLSRRPETLTPEEFLTLEAELVFSTPEGVAGGEGAPRDPRSNAGRM